MTQQNLIAALSADVSPVSPRQTPVQLANLLAIGATVALIALLATLGVQPGLETRGHMVPLLLKLAYAGALLAIAWVAVAALARPGHDTGPLAPRVAVPASVLAAVAIIQASTTPAAALPVLMLGGSWAQCPVRIVALALPVFVGLTLALRRQAPVRLRAAGAAAGLAAGSAAAAIYALACTEDSAAFVLIWYSLGIGVVTAVGALTGPRLLRW